MEFELVDCCEQPPRSSSLGLDRERSSWARVTRGGSGYRSQLQHGPSSPRPTTSRPFASVQFRQLPQGSKLPLAGLGVARGALQHVEGTLTSSAHQLLVSQRNIRHGVDPWVIAAAAGVTSQLGRAIRHCQAKVQTLQVGSSKRRVLHSQRRQPAQQQQAQGRKVALRLVAGGVAGAVSKTLVAPLERASTIIMTDAARRTFSQALAAMWQDGGFAGLYRGHAATLAKIAPCTAIQFTVFHQAKDALLAGHGADAGGSGRRGELSNGERLVAGAAAGAVAVAATYPLEAVRTHMALTRGARGGLLAMTACVLQGQGLAGLYRGFTATLLGDVLGSALGFTLFELGNSTYKERHGGRAASAGEKGLIGAVVAAGTLTCTLPLEVVRRRLQVQGSYGRPVLYRSTWDCVRQIAAREGLPGFYSAGLSSCLKVAPSVGCVYFMYAALTKAMGVEVEERPAVTVPPPAAKTASSSNETCRLPQGNRAAAVILAT